MVQPSSSHGSPVADSHQLILFSDRCESCPLRVGCDLRGTSRQCAWIRTPEGDIQPCTLEATACVRQLGDLIPWAEGQFATQHLPRAIARVAAQPAAGVATEGLTWVAATLTEVVGRSKRHPLSKAKFIERAGLARGTKVVLVMTGKDEVLARLGSSWRETVATVATAGYDLLLSPAFSVWNDHSAFHNRVQLVRCDRFATAFAAAGVPTVPPAGWFRRADMYDLARAVRQNPSINLMWMDWQTVPRGRAWEDLLREFDEFASLVPDVRFIVNGVGTSRRAALWERDSVACVISSGEFTSAVRQNRGPDAAFAARERILAFVAEPQRYRRLRGL